MRRGDVGGRECLSKTLVKFVKMELERRKKFLGWVTRGGKSDDGVGVGVTLEVGRAGVTPLVKFVTMEIERRKKS